MNSTQEEEDVEEEEQEGRRVQDLQSDRELSESLSDSEQDSLGEGEELGEGATGLSSQVDRGHQNLGSGYECGEDALMNETEQSYLRNFTREPRGVVGADPSLISSSPPALVNMPVYASNLDQHIDRAMLTQENTAEGNFYQPEPTLLTIASGAPPQVVFFAVFRS